MAEFYDSEVMREVARWDAKMASVTGKATSISVEPRIRDYFCTIAAERGLTVGQLLSHVDPAMRLEPTWRGKCSTRNLSSAVRAFVGRGF